MVVEKYQVQHCTFCMGAKQIRLCLATGASTRLATLRQVSRIKKALTITRLMWATKSHIITHLTIFIFVCSFIIATVKPNRIFDYFTSILMTKRSWQVNRAKIIRSSRTTFRVAFPFDHRSSIHAKHVIYL